MGSDNNNGKVPVKIIQLLVEKMEIGIQNSQEKINKEIEELTKVLVEVINKMNAANEILVGKLNIVRNRVNKMILVASVVFAMLMVSVALAVFGSQMLYRYNTNIIMKKIAEKYDKRNIEMPKEIKDELKDIIKEYVDEINKERVIEK